MPNLNNLSSEVIQKYLFSYLPANERGNLEQTNKRFRDLSRDYLSEELKRNFDLVPQKFKKLDIANHQEAIRLLYIFLYRCSKKLNSSEIQAIILIEETLIVCQEIKIAILKKKIREEIALFFNKIEQLFTPWIPDHLLIIGALLVVVSPFFTLLYSIVLIVIVAGLAAPGISAAGVGALFLFFAILALGLLLHASAGLIIEKIKLASEHSQLRQFKLSLQTKRANVVEIEKSFTYDKKTTCLVKENKTLTKVFSLFFGQAPVPFDSNDISEEFPELNHQVFQTRHSF